MDPWGCRPVWLTPGLSPRPLIPRCLWSLCCCLATGSIFLSPGPSGRSCLWLVYRRQSPARAPGGSDSPGSSFPLCSAWQPWELPGWGAGQPVVLGALPCRETLPKEAWVDSWASHFLQLIEFRSCLATHIFYLSSSPSLEALFLDFFKGE